MSRVSDFIDGWLVNPVAKRMIKLLEKQKTPDPDVSAFQLPMGYNSQQADSQRRQLQPYSVPFKTLRQLSVSHETSRAAINARKRQITQLDWEIVDLYPDTAPNYSADQINQIKTQFSQIGGEGVELREILDQIIEDLLVVDALVLYRQKTVGGKFVRVIPVDATTIKLRVDEAGLRPLPPEVAFEQWINGRKVADITTDEMIYKSMNPRTTSPYGLSPLESLVLIIDSSFKALMYNSRYLSDSNVPAGFLAMPEGWTPDQIKAYKQFFDAMVSTSTAQAKVFPVPSGTTYATATKPKDFMFKDFFDYLDRKVVMLFDITPQELGLSLQQYKENAESQEQIGLRKGLKPLAHLIQTVFNQILQQDMGYPELQFKFSGMESKFTMEDIKTLIPFGVISIDEVRNDMGLKAIGVNNMIIGAGGITPIGDLSGETAVGDTVSGTEQQKMDREKRARRDFKAWEHKALADVKKKGRITRDFVSEYIADDVKKNVSFHLKYLSDPELVKAVFENMGKKMSPIDVLLASDKAKKFKAAVKKALVAQIKPFTTESVIAGIGDTKKADPIEVDEMFDDIDGVIESVDIQGFDEYLKWSAEKGGQRAYNTIGLAQTFKLTSSKFKELLGDRETYLIDSVDETTKDWLAHTIATGKDQQLTNQEIADQIDEGMDEITTSRADTIVNTEVANASSLTELDTYKDQGVEKKIWNLSEDIGDDCGANAEAGAIPVDDEFPSGDDAPPAHPNCRCYLTADVTGEEIE